MPVNTWPVGSVTTATFRQRYSEQSQTSRPVVEKHLGFCFIPQENWMAVIQRLRRKTLGQLRAFNGSLPVPVVDHIHAKAKFSGKIDPRVVCDQRTNE